MDTVLPHLRSVTLEDSDHAFVGLPSVLYRADNLVKAALSVGCIGTAAVPVQLYGALARVEELAVHCTDLHAIVPSDFAWRNITLTARNALDLRFDAVLSFAETIRPLFPLPQLAGMLPMPGTSTLSMWNPIFCRALRCLLAVGGGDSGNAGCPGAQTSRLEGPFPRWPRCQWVVLPNGAATLQNLGRLAQLPLRSLLDVRLVLAC